MHPLVRAPGGARSEALLCTRNVWRLWPEADVDQTVLMESPPEKGFSLSPEFHSAFQLAPKALPRLQNHKPQR